MVRSDRFWRGLILSYWCILLHFYAVTDARRYDKCTTEDGRQGVCVVKRYCREATNQHLLPCDEENHCCPIPTTQRSAPTRAPDKLIEGGHSRVESDERYRPGPESSRGQEKPLGSGHSRTEQDERNRQRPDSHRAPERPLGGSHSRTEQDERNRQRPESPRGPEKPLGGGHSRVEQDERNRPRHESPRAPERPLGHSRTEQDERNRQRPESSRAPEKTRNDERPRTEPGEKDWGSPMEHERDDRLNKTPPPGDRRSPTRHQVDRPKHTARDRPQEDRYENDRMRPHKPQGNQAPADRHIPRYEDSVSRPSSSRPGSDPDRRNPPVRRPDDHFYPDRGELDLHHKPDGSRRPKPESEASKFPIRFPESYEFSVPRPKVPACGVKPYELFIAGGSESQEHEWPWMTAIFRRHPDSRPKTFLCGGSLINTKYVLTAAHCFINNYVVLPASAFVVRLGSHFLDSGEEYTVSNLLIHHNHSGSDFFNDIALVRLASEVFITDKIAPVCLPSPDMLRDNLVGRMATVAGWGDTSFRSSGARILQHVTVPIVSGEDCFSAYSRVRGAAFLARGSDHVICAGLREGGKDACLGDSGGPLMLKMSGDRWFVVGIVSLGYKCAEPGYPGVYTRVTHYMSWINTNMKKH